MSNFQELNQKNQAVNNILINKSERNATIASDITQYSEFDKSFQQATTFDSGKLIPIFMQTVYPKDIYEIDVSSLIRLSAQSSTPFMNINYDVNFFFIPFNQLDDKFKQVMGENPSYGYQETNLNIPQLEFDTTGLIYTENDLANYFNLPINKLFKSTNDYNNKINLYPFLAYGKVWNDWYRDQNYQESINISTWKTPSRTLSSSGYNSKMSFYESIIYGKGLAPTSKLPNYFSTILPYQQKGVAVSLSTLPLDNLRVNSLYIQNSETAPNNAYLMYRSNGQPFTTTTGLYTGYNSVQNKTYLDAYNGITPLGTKSGPVTYKMETVSTTGAISYDGEQEPYTINDLRNSIVLQHLFENWALCGSRYVEQLKSIWGIDINPLEIDRVELIGGFNDTLKFSNVVQTSATQSNSQLGNIASNLYNDISIPSIQYAAKQHGIILGVMTCRTLINNGSQGIPKFFRYNDMFDFFNPMFNGIGEQPVKSEELYYNDVDLSLNDDTLGYNEPFLDTKYNIDNANGYFSLNSNLSLFSQFLFGEKYVTTPIITDDWMQYNPNIVGNTLYDVSDNTKEFYHQFISIFSFQVKYWTSQPLFNKPSIGRI